MLSFWFCQEEFVDIEGVGAVERPLKGSLGALPKDAGGVGNDCCCCAIVVCIDVGSAILPFGLCHEEFIVAEGVGALERPLKGSLEELPKDAGGVGNACCCGANPSALLGCCCCCCCCIVVCNGGGD